MISNAELNLAYDFVEFTNKNVFLTGKAGTGKTTFLKDLIAQSTKRAIVVAPTGVAAINAKGVTIHSFFQLPFGPYIPGSTRNQFNSGKGSFIRMSKSKINIIKSLDLLIIDEISMVRADLLDGIDDSLRRYRRNSKPFGGVQLLMIGDIQQLSPVVKEDEWNVLKPHYQTLYFYGSQALQQTDYVSIELKYIYRQSDETFIRLLNNIRDNKINDWVLQQLNHRYQSDISSKDFEGAIILTTHNAKAQSINHKKNSQLKTRSYKFKANVTGEFQEYAYPTDFDLELKEGAQVMFVKNDISQEKRFYNGKIGIVQKIDSVNHIIHVFCAEDDEIIPVERMSWENNKYEIDEETKEIRETVIGKFVQFPLKLAWAITIHKSQGLTFEKVIIDAADSFAHGQVYVALSRCRSLEGILLSTTLNPSSIKTDENVIEFCQHIEQNQPDDHQLKQAESEFRQELIHELFDFNLLNRRILYCMQTTQDHAMALLTDLAGTFKLMNVSLTETVINVSNKFQTQLNELCAQNIEIEENKALQDRIIKASHYFHDKLTTTILEPLEKLSVDTDNKKVKKDVVTSLDYLAQDLNIKLACLQQCKNGFQIRQYLQARAKAAIEDNIPKQRQKKAPVNIESVNNQELFEILRQWRNQLASVNKMTPYQIFHQKSLVAIANELPASLSELNALYGIGKKKASEYGPSVLEIISTFCSKHNIPYNPSFEFEKKKSKPDTKKATLELFNNGKNIEQIAKERELAITTIQGHLAYYIQQGQLDIQKILSGDQLKEILSAIDEFETTQLNPLKSGLEDKYDYGQLKMAVAHYLSTR